MKVHYAVHCCLEYAPDKIHANNSSLKGYYSKGCANPQGAPKTVIE